MLRYGRPPTILRTAGIPRDTCAPCRMEEWGQDLRLADGVCAGFGGAAGRACGAVPKNEMKKKEKGNFSSLILL